VIGVIALAKRRRDDESLSIFDRTAPPVSSVTGQHPVYRS
jgi:hypothetical protein